MSRTRVLVLTLLAMIAFAGNSLLCRLALKDTGIDAASFTSVRLVSGALVLWLIVRMRSSVHRASGSWISGFALFAYAAAFSFAYISLSAGTGALLLFGSVQATMIGYGFWSGERLRGGQAVGALLALGGLVGLVLPGLSAPPLLSSGLMIGAGMAWGVYSLRGRVSAEPTATTAENFIRAVPFALALSVATMSSSALDTSGLGYAVASGALTSGIGYAIWYTALKGLRATDAAMVQLSVPAIAAAGGIVLLGEVLTMRLVLASVAILGGIGLVVFGKRSAK
jgi:drug/metabolite transporter (DMT)-like permease